MKKIILISFIIFSVVAFSEEEVENKNDKEKKKNYSFSLGGMVGYSSNLYHKDKNNVRALPILSAKYKDIYLLGTEIGYKKQVSPRVTLTGFTQLFGGITLQGVGAAIGGTQLNNSDMEDGYRAIDDRKTQIEFGIKMEYQADIPTLKLEVEGRGGERGGSGKVTISRVYTVTPKFLLIPQVNFTLIGKNMTNYYFGISEDEVKRENNDKLVRVYDTNKIAYATGIGIVGKYYITEKFSVFGLTEYQYVSDEIGNSDIVDSRGNYYVGVGLSYDF
jgi:outer membrane scaffolding protein for murein synthesis (MipA/OmpV family)